MTSCPNLPRITHTLAIVAALVGCGTGCLYLYDYKVTGYCYCEYKEDEITTVREPVEAEVCVESQDDVADAEAGVKADLTEQCNDLQGTLVDCSYDVLEVWSCSGKVPAATKLPKGELIPIPDPKFKAN